MGWRNCNNPRKIQLAPLHLPLIMNHFTVHNNYSPCCTINIIVHKIGFWYLKRDFFLTNLHFTEDPRFCTVYQENNKVSFVFNSSPIDVLFNTSLATTLAKLNHFFSEEIKSEPTDRRSCDRNRVQSETARVREGASIRS